MSEKPTPEERADRQNTIREHLQKPEAEWNEYCKAQGIPDLPQLRRIFAAGILSGLDFVGERILEVVGDDEEKGSGFAAVTMPMAVYGAGASITGGTDVKLVMQGFKEAFSEHAETLAEGKPS